MTVHVLDLSRHCLPQDSHSGHRWVLVVACAHGVMHGVGKALIAVEVRKTLAEIDGAMLGGQRGHDGEDRRAHLRQAAGEHRGAGGTWNHLLPG